MLYHCLVLAEASGIKIQDVFQEVMARKGKAPNPKYGEDKVPNFIHSHIVSYPMQLYPTYKQSSHFERSREVSSAYFQEVMARKGKAPNPKYGEDKIATNTDKIKGEK